MAKGTWNISTWNGTIWVADGTIPRPNADFPVPLLSTQRRRILADGSDAFITPETRTLKQQLFFSWIDETTTLKDKIEAYMTAHDYLKIDTHDVAIIFIGRFVDWRPTWLVGTEDKFNLEAIFEVME